MSYSKLNFFLLSLMAVIGSTFLLAVVMQLLGVYDFRNLRGHLVGLSEMTSDAYWSSKVRDEGGFILHFRHFSREREPDLQVFDQVVMNRGKALEPSEFDWAICLNRLGRTEGKAVGSLLESAGVKFSDVISSPLCRSRESAVLALNRVDQYWYSLIHRTALPVSSHQEFSIKFKKDLDSLEIESGKNIALFGHGATLSYDANYLFKSNPYGGRIDARDMGGVVVIERVAGEYFVRYVFMDVWNFTHSLIPVPSPAVIKLQY